MVGSAPSPNDTAGFGKIAARIKARCDELVGPSGTLPSPLDVDWFPFGRPQSSVRFTGRFSELLMLHGLFNQTALAGRSDACGAVVIDGIGGAGKTLLALEYAQRFAPAWPGGIVWLNHRGFDRDRLPDRAESRSESMSAHTALATSLGIELDAGADIIEVRSRIARWFVERGRVLWIVDDVPPDADLEVWTSPLPSESATLITSRHTKFGNSSYVPLSLDALSPEDAYTLITRNQRPADGEQRQAAIALCSRVSRHALAVDVTRALVRSPFEFTSQLELLEQRTIERLELAGQVVGDLAMRHDVSIAATLAASIDALGDHARGVLDIASVFESLPLPSDTLIHVVAGLAGTDSTAARSVVELGIADLASHSLARLDHCTTMVHRLVIDLKRTEETDVPQETVVDLADSALTEARS